jgi:DNA mismatch repair ATPase MutS
MGSNCLRSWFSTPLQIVDEIQFRLNIIEYLCRPENIPLRKELQSIIKVICNMKSKILTLKVSNDYKDWNQLLVFATAAIKLIQKVSNLDGNSYWQVFHVVESIEALESIINCISSKIDFEESKLENRIVIKAY